MSLLGINPDDIRPYDVYLHVTWMTTVVYILIATMIVHTVAIAAQIWAKYLIFGKVISLLKATHQLTQVTDSQKERIVNIVSQVEDRAAIAAEIVARTAKQSVAEVKAKVDEVSCKVDEVPAKTIEKIKESDGGSFMGGEVQPPSGVLKKPDTK